MKKVFKTVAALSILSLALIVSGCKKKSAEPDNGNSGSSYVYKEFSVSSNTKVCFSQGNLRYMPSTNTWIFADNQYDYIGRTNSNISSSYEGWIDLFGWGTGNNPTNHSANGDDYNMFTDWGSNTINNGDGYNWRTLTKDEWVYLFDIRNTESGTRYVKAVLNGVRGIILLPDNWDSSTYSLNNINDDCAHFDKNIISLSDWTNVLENNGAVFLPAAGCRWNTLVNQFGSYGYYWSSECTLVDNAYYVIFGNNYLGYENCNNRSYGMCVRLVFSTE